MWIKKRLLSMVLAGTLLIGSLAACNQTPAQQVMPQQPPAATPATPPPPHCE